LTFFAFNRTTFLYIQLNPDNVTVSPILFSVILLVDLTLLYEDGWTDTPNSQSYCCFGQGSWFSSRYSDATTVTIWGYL